METHKTTVPGGPWENVDGPWDGPWRSLGKDTYVLRTGRRSLGKYNDVLRAGRTAAVLGHAMAHTGSWALATGACGPYTALGASTVGTAGLRPGPGYRPPAAPVLAPLSSAESKCFKVALHGG